MLVSQVHVAGLLQALILTMTVTLELLVIVHVGKETILVIVGVHRRVLSPQVYVVGIITVVVAERVLLVVVESFTHVLIVAAPTILKKMERILGSLLLPASRDSDGQSNSIYLQDIYGYLLI